jgi:shikimate dehydrogenase
VNERWPGRLVLLGNPVSHSLSPRFQNAALAAAGIPLHYEALDVAPADLREALIDLRAAHGAGNATIPYKLAVASLCDALTPEATRTRAVNSFRMREGRLEGHNTDVGGFDAACDHLGVHRPGAVIWLIGAGGAARAVCAATAAWPGARVFVTSRRASATTQVEAEFAHVTSGPPRIDCGLVVNATPIGIRGDAHMDPAPVANIPRDARVMDLVYRPGETAWVRRCRTHGLHAVDGLEMLLHQGALAFQYWFDQPADLDVMRRALREER